MTSNQPYIHSRKRKERTKRHSTGMRSLRVIAPLILTSLRACIFLVYVRDTVALCTSIGERYGVAGLSCERSGRFEVEAAGVTAGGSGAFLVTVSSVVFAGTTGDDTVIFRHSVRSLSDGTMGEEGVLRLGV